MRLTSFAFFEMFHPNKDLYIYIFNSSNSDTVLFCKKKKKQIDRVDIYPVKSQTNSTSNHHTQQPPYHPLLFLIKSFPPPR